MKVFCCCLGVCFVLLVLEFYWFLPYLRTELTTFRRKLGNRFCFFLISRLLSLRCRGLSPSDIFLLL